MRHSKLILTGLVTAMAACGRPSPSPSSSTPPTPAAATAPAASPTVEALARAAEVLNAYRQAAGGPSLKALHSLKATGTAVSAGRPARSAMTYLVQYPDRFRQEESQSQPKRPPRIAVISFTGTDGWYGGSRLGGEGTSSDPAVRTAAETRAARQTLVNFVAGVLPSWLADSRFVTFASAGVVESGADRGALILSMEGKDGAAGRLLIDPDTHLPRRLIARYQPSVRPHAGDYTLTYSDFRAESGVQLPHTIVRESDAAGKITVTIQKYTMNPALTPASFSRTGRSTSARRAPR